MVIFGPLGRNFWLGDQATDVLGLEKLLEAGSELTSLSDMFENIKQFLLGLIAANLVKKIFFVILEGLARNWVEEVFDKKPSRTFRL